MENEKIVDYLLDCGVKPHNKGFSYLYEAISMIIKNNYKMPKITREMYPYIAEKYNDTPSRVERSCRHSIQTSKSEYKYLTCGEFMARSAIKIRFMR